jgi:heme/copper-type cytochrome/quinol oxidase subunit 2
MRFIRVGILLAVLPGGSAPAVAGDAPSRTIELVAKDNKFKVVGLKKGPLLLKAGETVTFDVTAYPGEVVAPDGAVHSFVVRELRGSGWDVRLKEGKQEFTLTAPGPGEYLIECMVVCGQGHDDMHLKLVVVP